MIAEALSGIEFSPNPQVARLLADDNTNSTQPTAHDSYAPPTPASDIFCSAPLETPRSFRHGPSLLPSPLASPDLPPPDSSQQPNQLLPENSPSAPLTPFADLPTPSRWLPSPTPPKLTPGMFIQTPDSLKRNRTPPDNQNSQPSGQIQQSSDHTHHVDTFERSPLNSLDPTKQEIDQPALRENSRARSRRGADKTPAMAIQQAVNPPEVRRRLFDQDDDDDTCAPEPPKTVIIQPANSSVETIRSQENGNFMPGLKSRLAPPPPICVPGIPNTTPGGVYLVSKRKVDDIAQAIVSVPNIALPSFNVEKFSEMIARRRDGHRHSQKVTVPNAFVGQYCKKKKSRGKQEVEEKRPMTERASLLLAEMRRQMLEARAGGKAGTSTGALAAGTDATNFLPYSSAVQAQAPSDAKKEKERPVCNCKASQCIKRYCPCFATSNFCGKGCGCRNCENTSEYSSVVGRARRVLLERDPNAFVPRIRNSQRSSGRGRQTIRGCNCRKGCAKNYCICKENGLICGVRCTCSGPNGCQNHDESKLEEVPKVIENASQSSYPSTSLIDQKTLKTRAILGISSNILRAEAGQSAATTKFNAQQQQLRHQDHMNTMEIPVSPGLGPFDVLPTPTTPSIPYNPFFEGDLASRKRKITFGNPMDGSKKIKMGDLDGSALSEFRHSGSRNYKYNTPSSKTFAQAGTRTGTPLTSKFLSFAEPVGKRDETGWRGHCNVAGMTLDLSHRDANQASNPSEERRIPHIPRIFRYKFGSGKVTNSFSFKP